MFSSSEIYSKNLIKKNKIKGTLQVSQQYLNFIKNKIKRGKRTSQFITREASLTVEAAFVLPMIIIAFSIFLFYINMVAFGIKVQFSLYDTARKLSAYSYNSEESESLVSEAIAKGMVTASVGTELIKSINVQYGAAGIFMYNSSVPDEDGYIDLIASYKIQIPTDIFGIGNIPVVQRVRVRAYSGYDEKSEEQEGENAEQIVYITESGTVYHLYRDCTYISPQVKKVTEAEVGTLRNSSGAKYYECEICDKHENNTGYVYITEYGTAYHNTANCSAIKHGIQAVKISEVEDRNCCSKCSKR